MTFTCPVLQFPHGERGSRDSCRSDINRKAKLAFFAHGRCDGVGLSHWAVDTQGLRKSSVLSSSMHPAKRMCNTVLAIHQSLACTRQVRIAIIMKDAKPSFSFVIQQSLRNIDFSTMYSEHGTHGTHGTYFNIGIGRWEVFKLAFWVAKFSSKSSIYNLIVSSLMPLWSRNLSPWAKAFSPELC